MSNKSKSGTQVFIDKGFPKGEIFCANFLNSPDFTLDTLKKLVPNGSSRQKHLLAERIAKLVENQGISNDNILFEFVQQPRKWLSFKIRHTDSIIYPQYKSPEVLLTEFGEDSWYGPIKDVYHSEKWYIRTMTIPFYEKGVSQAKELRPDEIPERNPLVAVYKIRWIVVAEVGKKHMALSWNGFSYNDLNPSSANFELDSLLQFPYWKYIPNFLDELSKDFEGKCEYPVLHKLILQDLWTKYLNNSEYIWRHLRIRADNRGVALNVHTTGACDNEERQMRGLQALSKKLASSALSALSMQETSEVINVIETALLGTLIQDWGAKSYEFSLSRNCISIDKNGDEVLSDVEIFRAHCYFSIGGKISNQDSFQHLHCFTKGYGGSKSALKFLLSELGYFKEPCDDNIDLDSTPF